jgi:hypothetical protein
LTGSQQTRDKIAVAFFYGNYRFAEKLEILVSLYVTLLLSIIGDLHLADSSISIQTG